MSETIKFYGLEKYEIFIESIGCILIYQDGSTNLPIGWYINKDTEYLFLGDSDNMKMILNALRNAIGSMKLENFTYNADEILLILKLILGYKSKESLLQELLK
jgi:hypothetical protein